MHLSSQTDVDTLKRAVLAHIDEFISHPHRQGNGVIHKVGEPLAVVIICCPQAYEYGDMIHRMVSNLPGLEGGFMGEYTTTPP